jgi:hypothetical protein
MGFGVGLGRLGQWEGAGGGLGRISAGQSLE